MQTEFNPARLPFFRDEEPVRHEFTDQKMETMEMPMEPSSGGMLLIY
jgi:hypothetical protein